MDTKVTTAESSNIASYAYSPTRSVLIVEYKNKGGEVTATWEYVKVPPSIFEEAKKAESIGKFIRARVQGYYEGTKISEGEK